MRVAVPLLLALTLSLTACDGGGLPVGFLDTPDGTGPQVIWDLEAEPLPEIPLERGPAPI